MYIHKAYDSKTNRSVLGHDDRFYYIVGTLFYRWHISPVATSVLFLFLFSPEDIQG